MWIENEKKVISNVIIFILSILALIPVIIYDNVRIEKICLSVSFLLLLFFAIYKRFIYKKNYFYFFGINIISCMMTAIIYGGQGIIINFLNVLLCFFIFNNIEISESFYKIIHFIISTILSIFLLTCKLKYIYTGHIFSFQNAIINNNTFALLTLANFFHWMCYISIIKNKKILKMILAICITSVCSYYIWISDCRTALLAIVLFILLIILKKNPFNYKMFRVITIVALIMNVLFTYIYIFYSVNRSNNTLILGKKVFSGRQIVWNSAWKVYQKSPLIGTGATIKMDGVNGTKTVSAHNTILSILYTIGIVPAVSFIYLMSKRIDNNNNLMYNRISQFAFVSSLIATFFESFYTDAKLYMLFLIFLIPIKVKQKEGEI